MATGAYFFAVRNGKRKPVELEYLTVEERKEKLGKASNEFLLNTIELCCKVIAELAPEIEDREE